MAHLRRSPHSGGIDEFPPRIPEHPRLFLRHAAEIRFPRTRPLRLRHAIAGPMVLRQRPLPFQRSHLGPKVPGHHRHRRGPGSTRAAHSLRPASGFIRRQSQPSQRLFRPMAIRLVSPAQFRLYLRPPWRRFLAAQPLCRLPFPPPLRRTPSRPLEHLRHRLPPQSPEPPPRPRRRFLAAQPLCRLPFPPPLRRTPSRPLEHLRHRLPPQSPEPPRRPPAYSHFHRRAANQFLNQFFTAIPSPAQVASPADGCTWDTGPVWPGPRGPHA